MTLTYLRPTFLGETYTLTDAATVATNAEAGNRFLLTIGEARTLGAPTNAHDGDFRVWEVTNSAGTESTLTLTTTAGGFLPMETIEATPAITFETAMAIPAGEVLSFGAYFSESADRWIPVWAVASV